MKVANHLRDYQHGLLVRRRDEIKQELETINELLNQKPKVHWRTKRAQAALAATFQGRRGKIKKAKQSKADAGRS